MIRLHYFCTRQGTLIKFVVIKKNIKDLNKNVATLSSDIELFHAVSKPIDSIV